MCIGNGPGLVEACATSRRVHPGGLCRLLVDTREPERSWGGRRLPRRIVRRRGHRRHRLRHPSNGRKGPAPDQPGGEAHRTSAHVATIIQLVASFVLPIAVIAAGSSDWVLSAIAITIGPLLLRLDHSVHISRYRPVDWALIVGPVFLGLSTSGASLAPATGIAAGALFLGTATAGFHDLAGGRELGLSRPGRLALQT